MNKIAIFDVNETTLDLSPVRRTIDELAGGVGGFTIWFQKLLQLSMTSTTTGNYLDFTELAKAALQAVFDAEDRHLPGGGWDEVRAAMGSLDAYPDVKPGLTALRDAGWTTVSLTNSAPTSVNAQLERAGLTPLFDLILSVEAVQAYKPAQAPYLYAAQQIGFEPSTMWMVACHDWDLAGARAVGMSTAYVSRPAMSYAPNYPAADLVVDSFIQLAERLTGLEYLAS